MAKPDYSKSFFKDRVDPEDDNFRLVELRLPLNPALRPFESNEFEGFEAAERIRRFCAGYLAGFGDLSEREAEKIIKKSHVRKGKN